MDQTTASGNFNPALVSGNISCDVLTALLPCGVCIVLCDEDVTLSYANDFYYGIFGYSSASNAQDRGFTNLKSTLLPQDYSNLQENTRKCLSGEIIDFERETLRTTVSGKSFWLLSRFRYLPEHQSLVAVVFDITSRKEMEERLRISEEEYRVAAEQGGNHIIRYDIKSKTEYRTQKTSNFLGTPLVVANVPDSVIASGAIATESEKVYLEFFEAIFRGDPTGSALFKVQRSGKHAVWRHVEFTTIFDSEGKPFQAIISLSDATKRHEREIAYMQHRQKINDAVLNGAMYYEFNLTKNICEHEEGTSFSHFISSGEVSYSEFYKGVIESYVHKEYQQKIFDFFLRDRLISNFYNGKFEESIDAPLLTKDSDYKWMRATVQVIFDPYSSDIKVLLLVEDIDSQKQAELLILSRSEVDPLTGLLNRITFIERVTSIIDSSEEGTLHALILIDIDHFKQINDRFGHICGDKILYDTSANIFSCISEIDLIGRYGGDEITVFLNNVSSEVDVAKRAEEICLTLYREISEGIMISGSLGVAIYPKDGKDYNELVQNADAALYEAKRNGRNRVFHYSPEIKNIAPVSQITPVEAVIDLNPS